LRAGDATRSNVDAGIAHRQAAHAASSTTAGGGPAPEKPVIGCNATVAGGSGSTAVTHPPTGRLWSRMRTRLPTGSWPRQRSGTE
jgi:hypothetical protein